MTVSELRYLITANELNEGGNGARMSAMAKRLSVTKVYVMLLSGLLQTAIFITTARGYC